MPAPARGELASRALFSRSTSAPYMRAGALIAWLCLGTAASVGVNAGDALGAPGPRGLPPTFVPLEVEAFPRPADEACRDNRRVVHVHPRTGIARALTRARPGTTLQLAPGTYVENPGEPTALEWSTPDVCLRAAGPGRSILRAGPGQTYGLAIHGNDTVIDGLVLRGFGASIGMSTGGGGGTLRRITIERVTVRDVQGEAPDGIVAYDDHRALPGAPPTVDGLLLRDVSVRGAALGVSCNFGPCEHWWLERVRVSGRRGLEGSGADAFAIEDGRQIVVMNSVFRHAAADGIDTKADDVVVMRSRVIDVGRNGVKLWRGGDVINTVVDGSGADAALVGDGPGRYRYLHVLVTGHDPGGTGYVATWGYDDRRPGTRLEIINSIFSGNASGGLFAPADAAISVRHTIFGDRRGKLFDLSDGSSYTVRRLRAFERAGFGADNLAADPALAGRRGRWMPRRGSPAIDAAESVPRLRRDLFGHDRRSGRGPDIGPVETAPG